MDEARFEKAIAAFDRLNAEDPTKIVAFGVSRPRELVRAERLSFWVSRLEPNPSEALSLAARCQHIRRWQVPRASYPEGRVGYLKWRTDLARFHADTAASVLHGLGYDSELIGAVRRINLKQNLRTSPDTQTIEDGLCLEFLEFEFAEFSSKHAPEKVLEIVQKTWKKMSARGHEQALQLPLEERALNLVRKALSS